MKSAAAAELLARFRVDAVAEGNAVAAPIVVLSITMFASDVMNEAATVAVLSPIALVISATLRVNPDMSLMAVAIGASCAFLTPIGQQHIRPILRPGGPRSSDHWEPGRPLTALIRVVQVALPVAPLAWLALVSAASGAGLLAQAAGMRHGSVTVAPGARGETGARFDALGSCGASTEPYLHIRAWPPAPEGVSPISGVHLALRIAGRFLLHTDRLRGAAA